MARHAQVGTSLSDAQTSTASFAAADWPYAQFGLHERPSGAAQEQRYPLDPRGPAAEEWIFNFSATHASWSEHFKLPSHLTL
jgi:hypothetical protein